MNLLRNAQRDLTKRLLNPLANPLFVACLPRLISPLVIAPALNLNIDMLTLRIQGFLFIIRVAGITKHLATRGQLQMHHLQSCYIGHRTRQQEKLHRFFIEGNNELNRPVARLKTKKESPFGGNFAPVLFSLYQTATPNLDVVTNSHRQRINHILVRHIQGFEQVGQIVEQYTQGMSQSM